MNLGFVTGSATWSTGFVLAAGITAVWSLYTFIRRKQKGALLYSLACEATDDFYRLAREIIADPATPDALYNALIEMTDIITHDQKGKKFYKYFSSISDPDAIEVKDDKFSDEMHALAKHRVDLYEKANDAFSSWIFAISAAHGHSDLSISIAMAKSAERGFLLSLAGRLKALFDQNGGDGIDGGKLIPVKNIC